LKNNPTAEFEREMQKTTADSQFPYLARINQQKQVIIEQFLREVNQTSFS
jgi:hypothetical protein